MVEWIANCIIEGIDGFGEELTYERALNNLNHLNPRTFKMIKKQIDSVLISKGRADLIKKI